MVNGSICLLVPFFVYLKAFTWKQRYLLQPTRRAYGASDETEEDEIQVSTGVKSCYFTPGVDAVGGV